MELTFHIPHLLIMILFYVFLVVVGIVIGIIGVGWFVVDALNKGKGGNPWWW
jgi:hypothetical protein